MENNELKTIILEKILELTEKNKEYIHSTNIEFSSDDKKVTIEFNI